MADTRFMVQRRGKIVNPMRGYPDVYYWADTFWPTLVEAREQHPEEVYREVMVRW